VSINSSKNLKTFQNIKFEYEKFLANGEFQNLKEDLNSFIKRTAYFQEIYNQKTYHCYLSHIRGKYQKDESSQYFVHSIYPYKGKFHPQMIKGLINYINLRQDEILLDPFMGSGTTIVVAKEMGLKSIGLDLNPFCCFLASMKCDCFDINLNDIKDHNKYSFDQLSNIVKDKGTNFNNYNPIEKFYIVTYLSALSDNRYIKKDVYKAFIENHQRFYKIMIQFNSLKTILNFKFQKENILNLDAKTEIFKDNSVDAIITSPPYSITLDYIKNDIHSINFLNIDALKLYQQMIGLRGGNLNDKIDNYYSDLSKIFQNFFRILKENSYFILIIGDLSINGLPLNIPINLIRIAINQGFKLDKILKKPIYSYNNRNKLKNEYITIFKKI